MNDRKIIWITGQEGNEGKYWFESYIRSLYGSYLVAHFDIINKIAVLLHIMSCCALETTDIFLFNHQRCVPSEECCYSLLEMIKDRYVHVLQSKHHQFWRHRFHHHFFNYAPLCFLARKAR